MSPSAIRVETEGRYRIHRGIRRILENRTAPLFLIACGDIRRLEAIAETESGDPG